MNGKFPIMDQDMPLRAAPIAQNAGAGGGQALPYHAPSWRHQSFPAESVGGRVVDALRTVFDPEIPVNIYELGLIYQVDVRDDEHVHVVMTLTSPMCPVAGSLPGEVEEVVRSAHGVRNASVELVWDPPWSPDLMGEAARLELNMF